jgi:predicted component of type VI protein secretion system
MMKTTIYSLMLAALTTALAACTSTTPNLDKNFGQAVNQAKAQQTLNPDASLNTDPVAGLDGVAADAAIDNYKSVQTPPEPARV